MTTLSKADQEAEGAAREVQNRTHHIDPADMAEAVHGDHSGDAVERGGQDGAAPAAGKEATERPLPPVRGAFEDKRAAIVARFRTDRTTEAAEQADEISDFTRSGMPPEFAPVLDKSDDGNADTGEQAEGVAPAARAPAADVPRMVKVKVNGVEKEISLEDAIAKAQVALASEDILGEAKALRDEMRNMARRPADQAGHHAGEQSGHHARTDGAQPGQPTDREAPLDQEDAYGKLVETIQFGDPADARNMLEKVVGQAASQQVKSALLEDRLKDEGARTQKVLTEFESQHPEIASDEDARAVIERRVTRLQLEDIKALGVDPAQLEVSVADAHRYYRAQGYKVRTPHDMLEKAVDEFVTWKGGAKAKQTVETVKGEPRIEVTVDRTTRRQAIQQQPSRTVVPKQAATGAAQPRDRSDIVASVVAARQRPRGKVVA